jgi:hypothetical protein
MPGRPPASDHDPLARHLLPRPPPGICCLHPEANVAIIDANSLAVVKVLEVEVFPTGIAFTGQ